MQYQGVAPMIDKDAYLSELKHDNDAYDGMTDVEREAMRTARKAESAAACDNDKARDKLRAVIDDFYTPFGRPHNNETAAELFLNHHGDTVCYASDLGRWLFFDGKAWRIDSGDAVRIKNLLLDFNKELIAVASARREGLRMTAGEIKEADKFYSWAVGQNNRPALDNVISILAARKSAIIVKEFDTQDALFNVGNGTVNLRTGKIQPHDPEDKITILCETDYNPSAVYDRWDSFLLQSCGRAEYVAYLQKELGYAITGETKDESIFLFYGPPVTGKSTFYEPIKENTGDYSRYVSFSTLKRTEKDGGGPREDLLRLRTCRLAICSEVNKGTKFDTALLKKIASGEPIPARGIHARNSVEFPPKFKILIGTNYPPVIEFDDAGAYRRFKVNPWDNIVLPENIDTELKERFKTDKNARERILAWLIEGAVRYYKEGLRDIPREMERAASEYKRQQNPLYLFIEDYCVEDVGAGTLDDDGKIKRRGLCSVDAFVKSYNDAKGEYGAHENITNKGFGRRMSALPYDTWHDRDGRGYVGIRIKTIKELDEDTGFYDVRDARAALETVLKTGVKPVTSDVCTAIPLLINYKKDLEKEIIGKCNVQTSNVTDPVDQTDLAQELLTLFKQIKGASLRFDCDSEIIENISIVIKERHPALDINAVYDFIKRWIKEDKTAQALIADILHRNKREG
jgi:P4 family phage/plasmid primase-like protien